MSFIVHIRPEAESDLEEAALWYEKQNPRLGDEFLDEVQGIFKVLSENPSMRLSIAFLRSQGSGIKKV